MISFLVVPLLWICPTASRIPILGARAQEALAASPARILVCTPISGVPERYDAFPAAQDRVQQLGLGASLSICQPDGSCKPIKISWSAIPTFGGIP
jgi:hypothetical protein